MSAISTLIAVSIVVATARGSEQCSTDWDCGDSRYCTQGVCEACIPCADLYNRQPSSGPRNCAKTEIDCGSCLRGFRAEELTGQRYSFRCNRVTDNEEIPESTASGSSLVIRPDVILFLAAAILLSLVVLCFIFYPRRSTPTRVDEEKGQSEPLFNPEPPPPYAPSAPDPEETEALIQVVTEPNVQRVEIVRATPIGPYHSTNPNSNEFWLNQENFEHLNVADQLPRERYEPDGDQMDLNAGDYNSSESFSSAETIPSLWEPGSTPDLTGSQPVAELADRVRSCSSRSHFSRSVSLDSGTDRRNLLISSCLDEAVAGISGTCSGIYSGIHVKLTSQRNVHSLTPNRQSTVSSEDGYNSEEAEEDPSADDRVMEPEPPEPFVLPEQVDETRRTLRPLMRSLSTAPPAHGSDDSAIFEAGSRRRTATSAAIDFTFRFSVKRFRED